MSKDEWEYAWHLRERGLCLKPEQVSNPRLAELLTAWWKAKEEMDRIDQKLQQSVLLNAMVHTHPVKED